MSEKQRPDKKNRLTSQSRPRLKAFLRQASAIIAAEKGLNSSSHQKLKTLAEYLKMPRDEFDEAMSQLQLQEKMPPGLNRYEKEFVQFLQKQFKGLKGGILNVSKENKAVELAATKYQIPETRARQLIQAQAERMDVGRIAKGDAEAYVEQLIASRIGDATFVSEDSRERFYKIGNKWGVDAKDVDAIVLQVLADNRVDHAELQPKSSIWVMAVVVLLLVCSGSMLAAYSSGLFKNEESEADGVKEDLIVDDEGITLVYPEWWERTQTSLAADALLEFKGNRSMLEDLLADELEDRSVGLKALITAALSSKPESDAATQLLCRVYYFAPDQELADQTVRRLEDDLVLQTSRVPAQPEKLRRVFQANRCLARLAFFEGGQNKQQFEYRNEAINNVIEYELGFTPQPIGFAAYFEQSERLIAINEWNHLIQTSWSAPNQTALAITPLFELTKSTLKKEELQRFHNRTVMSVLESDATLWEDIKDELTRTVDSLDGGELNSWISHYQSSTINGYRDWLGEQLARVSNAEIQSRNPDEIERALAAVKTRFNRSRYRDLIESNAKLDKLNSKLASTIPADVSPQMICDAASVVTLNMMLAPEDQASFQFEAFERAYFQGTPDISSIARRIIQSSEKAEAPELATPSDYRIFDESLKKLQRLSRDQIAAKKTALDDLAQVSTRLQNIEYQQALVLARYYLKLKQGREAINAEKQLKQFIRLPNFGLAIVDEIVESDVDMDQALTLAQYFFDGEYQIVEPIRWKEEVKDVIFRAVLKRCLKRIGSNSFESERWRLLKENLIENYRQRLKLTQRLDAGQLMSFSLLELAKTNLQDIARTIEAGGDFPIDRFISMIEQSELSEMQQLVAINKLSFKLLADDLEVAWPLQAQKITSLEMQFSQHLADSKTVGQQLLATEIATARIWALRRRAILERLVVN